jgi:FixJ family two-component response regulator
MPFSILDRESIPIVLFDSDSQDIDWREVIQRGRYDLIQKPIREEQIVRTVQFAWLFLRNALCRHQAIRKTAQ